MKTRLWNLCQQDVPCCVAQLISWWKRPHLRGRALSAGTGDSLDTLLGPVLLSSMNMYSLTISVGHKSIFVCCIFLQTEVIPVHAIKAYRGNIGIAPFILNPGMRWRWVGYWRYRGNIGIAPFIQNPGMRWRWVGYWRYRGNFWLFHVCLFMYLLQVCLNMLSLASDGRIISE